MHRAVQEKISLSNQNIDYERGISVGRVDLVRYNVDYLEIWEIKHENLYALERVVKSADKQLSRYLLGEFTAIAMYTISGGVLNESSEGMTKMRGGDIFRPAKQVLCMME